MREKQWTESNEKALLVWAVAHGRHLQIYAGKLEKDRLRWSRNNGTRALHSKCEIITAADRALRRIGAERRCERALSSYNNKVWLKSVHRKYNFSLNKVFFIFCDFMENG